MASIIEKRLSLHHRLDRQERENHQLKSQNVQLQALANLGSATSMIAHEINNLLTPLANYAALAARNPENKELVDKALAKTVRNCERASKIMASMLAVANGQANESETVAVRWLIDEAFACLCRDFSKDGITVKIDAPEALEVPCVPVQIQQMLMNLFLNARDAMLPGGGTLTITASDLQDCAEITVADTGKGIPPETLKSIFKPFFTTKAGQDSPATCSGSGVGLAFCKRIIDAHEGDISVTSAVDRGTTFHIRLPRLKPGR